jgi:hypothetical protein
MRFLHELEFSLFQNPGLVGLLVKVEENKNENFSIEEIISQKIEMR